jgi:hypothetical protein
LPSIRFFSRARTRTESQRGFVLVAALVLAILYFMLMELMMIDSSRALVEAQRFRARVVAATEAENGAELACVQMVTRLNGISDMTDDQGHRQGQYRKGATTFEVTGEGTSGGTIAQRASVYLKGRIEGTDVKIDYANHSQ